MKKLIALMTAAIIALSAVSCSKTGPGYTTDTTNTTETTETVPEGMPAPVEPQDAVIDEDTEHTCKIMITCATLVDNHDLDPDKRELVPDDGIILPETEVTFFEGESVFNLLRRVCRQNSIHLEFEDTPIYNSAYIEGIANLYEFDAGKFSGWLYSVNGWYPNYGCSRYQLKEGDVIVWEYTTEIGGGQFGINE